MKQFLNFALVLTVLSFLVSCKSDPKTEEGTTTADTTQTSQPAPAPSTGEVYKVSQGKIMWTGEAAAKSHHGTINISEGELNVANGAVTGGTFTIDINTIMDEDLTGKDKTNLEGHLKSPDFFDAAKYPHGKFVVSKIEPASGVEGATHVVTGDLTLKDKTNSISFPVNVVATADMVTVTSPSFEIDRTKWDIKYNSGIIGTVKEKLINDAVKVVLSIEAKK